MSRRTLVVMAVLTSRTRHRVPAAGALTVIGFHLTAYGTLTFLWDSGIHFIHLYAILFIAEVLIMSAFAWRRGKSALIPPEAHRVDMTPWRWAYPVAALLLSAMVGVYLLFSPLGVARADLT